jgi:hypothetical protein
MDRLFPTRPAAEILGIAPQTLRNHVWQGDFTPDETWRESPNRRVFTEAGLQRFRDERKASGENLGPLFPPKSPTKGKSPTKAKSKKSTSTIESDRGSR